MVRVKVNVTLNNISAIL